jgi:hypothetical protein
MSGLATVTAADAVESAISEARAEGAEIGAAAGEAVAEATAEAAAERVVAAETAAQASADALMMTAIGQRLSALEAKGDGAWQGVLESLSATQAAIAATLAEVSASLVRLVELATLAEPTQSIPPNPSVPGTATPGDKPPSAEDAGGPRAPSAGRRRRLI